MQEPRARVIGHPADGDIVTGDAEGHNVSARRVDVVIRGLAGAPHNVKRMLCAADKQYSE